MIAILDKMTLPFVVGITTITIITIPLSLDSICSHS